MSERVAVVGVGSTNFAAGVGDPDAGTITDVSTERTRPQDLPAQVADAVAALPGAVDAVGVATAGLVEGTTVRQFDTVEGDTIEAIDLGAAVEDLPVIVENDCNASALAEWHYGAGADHDCLAHLTFGTGIGCGVVERGRLLRGETGHAGEVGLLPVGSEALASTGVPGAWEAFCSGRGIPRFARHRLAETEADSVLADAEDLTAPDVFRAADQGDAFAQSVLEEVARLDGKGIGALANAFEPGLVTVGGGVALNNREWLLDGIDRHLDRYCFVDQPEIRVTELGDRIGLYGALAAYRATTGES